MIFFSWNVKNSTKLKLSYDCYNAINTNYNKEDKINNF